MSGLHSQRVALGEVALINPRVTKLSPDMQCAFVPMEAVDDETGRILGSQTRLVADVQKGYTPFQENDVLFAKITPCMENGKAAIARRLKNGVGYGSTEFHVLRASDATIPEWIFYFLRKQSTLDLAAEFMTGSAGQRRVPSSFLDEVVIPLPPLPQQKQIAQRLERADRLRRLRAYALEVSDRYLQGVFLEMFGDPETNPKGWDVYELGDLGEVQGGLQVSKKRDVLNIKVPYLRVANSFRFKLDLEEIKYMGVTLAELNRTRLMQGDILCVEGHGNIDEVGRASLWNGQIKDCVHQNHLIRFRSNLSKINPVYACFFINSGFGRRYFRTTSNTTSGLNTTSTGTVKECPVLLPPTSLQTQFSTIVQKHERLRTMQVEALRQAELLYSTLLEQAFGARS